MHLYIDSSRNLSLDDACQAGIRCFQSNNTAEAHKIFLQIIAVDPFHPRSLNALAIIETGLNNYSQAGSYLERLLSAYPDFEKGYNSRGQLHLKLKQYEQAEKDFCKALELNPDFAEAYGNLGQIYLLQRKASSAADCFAKAISINPDMPQAYCNLAEAQIMQGMLLEAENSTLKALELNELFASAYYCKGEVSRERGNYAEAIAAYKKAITLNPNASSYCRALSNVYLLSSDLNMALETIMESLRLDTTDPLAEYTFGNILWGKGLFYEAEDAYRRGLNLATLSTDVVLLRSGLGSVALSLGEADRAIAEFRAGLQYDPANLLIRSNLLLTMHYSSNVSSEDIFRESLLWGESVSACDNLPGFSINTPLRIGFVSSDFKTHSVSYFFEPLIAHLDRNKFRVYCYSGVIKPDATTERIKTLADNWIDCAHIPDEQLAENVRSERIDVLVDLSGHTGGTRLPFFALKPAPIQVTWLGYPGTTGLKAIDYRLTDRVADPIGMTDSFHSEKLLRVPDCFLCYQPPAEFPKITPPPSLDKKYVTFGSFNNLAKISSAALKAWSKILKALPDSKLVIKSKLFLKESYSKHWLELLARNEIDISRVNLVSYEESKWNHFARYSEIDIALDTFPYNGTTTTCETLLMGVPVIALSGDRHASRVSASLLSCIGLSELIAANPDEYVALAIALANDPQRLISYRCNIREMLLASPVCDASAFTHKWQNTILELVSR